MTSTQEVSVEAACCWFGISRQAYYQAQKREQRRGAEDQLILDLIQGIREHHPRMGGRKLYHELQGSMAVLDISRGRDTFFTLLRRHDLLVETKRNGHRTTWSGKWRYPNLLADLTLERVDQAWVGDITYLATEQGFLYLALLTDAYSRFIVGYDLSSSLAVEGALRALNLAIAQRDEQSVAGLIHHSDHGVQYTATPYRDRLCRVQIQSSMGEVGNCYDNALAERVNGILKCEYALDALFVSHQHAQQAVHEAIWLYNYERPHLALNYLKPAQVHFGL